MKKIKLITLLWMFSFLGVFAQSPGGVSSSLSLWLKADADVYHTGTTQATNTQTVETWIDLSSNGINTTAPSAGKSPRFNENRINFNPALDFDGTDDELTNASSPFPSGTSDETNIFIVSFQDVLGGSLFGFNDDPSNDVDKFHSHYVWTDGLIYFDVDNSTGSGRISGTAPFTLGEASIGGFINSVSNTNQEILVNGNSLASDNTGHTQTSGITRIGSAILGGQLYFDGKIAEILAFDTDLTPTQKQQVQSYLAIKYGITLGINYLASDGTTTVYDVSTYGNDIAGIGADSNASLNQKQSRSINSDAIVTMGLTSIEATNAANTATFAADKTFMMWGNDNNSSPSFASTGAPSGYEKLARTWKITETQTVGNVKLTVDVNNAAYNLDAFNGNLFLLKGTDLSTATPMQMYDDGTNGDATSGDGIWTLNAVDFATGDLFSFATFCKAVPGGLGSNLQLWLKADVGVNSTTDGAAITNWTDQSSEGTIGSGTGHEPDYINNATGNINFNPAINYNGSSDYIDFIGDAAFGSSENSVFVIYEPAASQSGFDLFLGNLAQTNFILQYGLHSGGGYYLDNFNFAATGSSINLTSPVVTKLTPHLGEFQYSNNTIELFHNTASIGTKSGFTNFPDGGLRVGSSSNSGNPIHQYAGKIAEIIVYDSKHTGTDRQKVNSYLAIKYGMTLTDDYLAGDGSTIYSVATYGNAIAGIGQDICQGLNQKQSRSVNSDAIVTMGLTSIETTNMGNSATFAADKTFMMWGNDNNSGTDFASAGAPSGYSKLARTWKVTETQTVGNVMLTVDVNNTAYNLDAFNGNLFLLKGTDLSTATPIQMYDDGTNGDATSGDGIWTLNAVDFATGDLFSFATVGCPNQVALAAVNGTVTASASCTEVNGWTYYFDNANPTNAVFAIEHQPTGGNTNNFEAEVTITVTATPTTAAGIYAVEDNTNQEGNFVMGRSWNVNVTSGTLNGNVNVRFYYDPAELAIIQSEATTFANASTPALNLSDPIWFKTVGATYDPTTNTATTANNGNVIEFGNLTPATEDGITYVEMTGISSFSGGSVSIRASASPSPTLPVELTSFNVYTGDCKSILKWATASEIDFSHFELEKSENGIDFRKIATIQAEGGTVAQSYFYQDAEANERNYYRLRMVDLDGSAKFSKIEFVKKECGAVTYELEIYPNPVSKNNQLNVQFFTENRNAKFTIVDILGRPVRSLNVETTEGWNTIDLDISDLNPANYLLKMENGIDIQTQQFVILK